MLLLDEPTAGVAQRETEAFGPLIKRIQAELGATIVLIEHDIPLVMSISDRVYCLAAGQCIAEGLPEEVRHDPAVIAAYLGTDERAIARSGGRRLMSAAPDSVGVMIRRLNFTEGQAYTMVIGLVLAVVLAVTGIPPVLRTRAVPARAAQPAQNAAETAAGVPAGGHRRRRSPTAAGASPLARRRAVAGRPRRRAASAGISGIPTRPAPLTITTFARVDHPGVPGGLAVARDGTVYVTTDNGTRAATPARRTSSPTTRAATRSPTTPSPANRATMPTDSPARPSIRSPVRSPSSNPTRRASSAST